MSPSSSRPPTVGISPRPLGNWIISVSSSQDIEKISVDEKYFRWAMNEDAMSTEKLAEGIRNFAKDARLLEELIAKRL